MSYSKTKCFKSNSLFLCRAFLFFSLIGFLCLATPAFAWRTYAHIKLTEATLKSLPDGFPEFFKNSTEIPFYANDPDIQKNRFVPKLKETEGPEHFIDLEYFEKDFLPGTRYEYLKLLGDKKLDPRKAGLLPYAVLEWTERLTIAFAEFRRDPDNSVVRNKCIVYAGILAHYAQDACMPLHTTINYDGRISDNYLIKQGFHFKVDGLMESLKLDVNALCKNHYSNSAKDIMSSIHAEIERSNSSVGRIYGLAPQIMKDDATPDVVKLAEELSVRSVMFTAMLYLSAWENSEKVEIPEYFFLKGNR